MYTYICFCICSFWNLFVSISGRKKRARKGGGASDVPPDRTKMPPATTRRSYIRRVTPYIHRLRIVVFVWAAVMISIDRRQNKHTHTACTACTLHTGVPNHTFYWYDRNWRENTYMWMFVCYFVLLCNPAKAPTQLRSHKNIFLQHI